MPKVSDTYASLVRGVSQQIPESRLPGQHGEQVNMLSDPVRGLSRRDGSVRVSEGTIRPVGTDPTAFMNDLGDNYTETPITLDSENFILMTRRVEQTPYAEVGEPVYMTRVGGAQDGELVPVSLTAPARALLEAGVTSAVAAGGYLLMSHASPVVATETELWDTEGQRRRAFISVRGGTYGQTYSVTLGYNGESRTVTHTTPTSSYPGVLDTSGIPYAATDYAKQINDAVNAYNTLVNQWIGTSAAAVLPQAIALALKDAMVADGWAGTAFGGEGVFIYVEGAVISIGAPAFGSLDIEAVSVDDAAYGQHLKVAFQTVEDPTDLPSRAPAGFVIQVSPQGKDDYYLKAKVSGGYDLFDTGSATWEEGTATQTNVESPFLVGAFDSGTLYVAESPEALDAVIGGTEVPRIGQRVAGDTDSSVLPHFCGRVINHMVMFQDRLLVTSDNVVTASRIGDYFNFFRTSALTVLDDDAIEVFSTGSEDDTIRHSVFFDRSLVMFGDRQQYVISGKLPFTPSTANPTQSSAHRGAAAVRPLAHGDNVFYSKSEGDRSKVYQISVGQSDDTSSSVEITQQLDDYIGGQTRAIVGVSMPDTLVLRTSADPSALYAYRYLDAANGERLVDAWHTYSFDERCGKIVGVYSWNDRLRILFARVTNEGVALVTDELRLAAGSKLQPHLDSQSQHTGRDVLPGMQCAWGVNTVETRAWQGRDDGDTAALFTELGEDETCVVGFPFDAYTVLTNPVRRDREGNARVFGRLTISKLVLSHANAGGYSLDVATEYGDFRSLEFNSGVLGASGALLGVVGLVDGEASAFIGRERREYTATLRADSWLPVSITNISWVGQDFNRIN